MYGSASRQSRRGGLMAEKQAVRKPGDSQALWVLGGLYEVRVQADETAGAATVMEFTIPEGAAPPLHTHAQHEIVYVLEGKARYHVDGEVTEVGPGTVVNLPVGTVESFEALGQVRLLITHIPAGLVTF